MLAQRLHDARSLLDGSGLPSGGGLARLQRVLTDRMAAFNQHLQHETAHLAPLAVLGGAVVQYGHVAGPLQQTVEVVGVDAYLVFYRCQFVGLAYAVRNKRAVVDAARHVALIAGQQQHMVEVQVARLQHTHHLQPLSRLAVEGNAGLLHQLACQPLHRDAVYRQVAAFDEPMQTVDQGVGPEQRFLEQRVVEVVLGILSNLPQ